MKLVFLSAEFYKDYADCYEIEQKPTRPYTSGAKNSLF